MSVSDLPAVNATLNAISTIFLVIGFVLIKRGEKKAHRYVMTGALISSVIFLSCYLFYHYKAGHVEFPKAYPLARKIYLVILVPHILLAVANLPLIIILVTAAIRGNFERHRRFARFTYPSWLFVSVSGVVIYFMVYHWFLPVPEKTQVPVRVLKEKAVAGNVSFSPASQSLRVEAGESEVAVTFQVNNKGDNPVMVNKLESGCSCLSVSIDSRRIAPGGIGTITGIFSIEKLSGEADKIITVGTDQEGVGDTFLNVRFKVAPLYVITERMTSWEVGAKPVTKIVTFKVARKKTIRILKATSSREEMSCEVKAIEEGRYYEIALTPSSTSSNLLGIVRIETDCELEHHSRPLAYFSIQ